MTNSFSYSVLKYSHSKFLGEQLNVGILFVFPSLGVVEFHSPKRLHRLSVTYPDLSEKLIRNYLSGFERKSKNFAKYLSKYFDLNDLIRDHLIIEDASSLQFDKFKHAVYFGSIEETKKLYLNLILGPYQSETHSVSHKTSDKDVVTSCKRLILNQRPDIQPLLKQDEHRILRNNRVTFKSDFYWQNGTTNFVKGISFDLGKEENIIDKSILINGQLRQLEKSKDVKDARIDLLIYKPSDSRLHDAFREATDIISQVEINKSLVENIEDYSSKVISEIEFPD